MKTIKSITSKSVFGTPKKDDIGNVAFYVTGIVDATFVHNTLYGENVGLKGDFVAINANTGEQFKSEAAFLPGQITEQIKDQVQHGVVDIEFSCSVKLMATDKNASGYTWVVDAPKTEERKAKAELLLANISDFPLAIENKTSKTKAA